MKEKSIGFILYRVDYTPLDGHTSGLLSRVNREGTNGSNRNETIRIDCYSVPTW